LPPGSQRQAPTDYNYKWKVEIMSANGAYCKHCQSHHHPIDRCRAHIEDQIKWLEAENAKACGWGAAVGARLEEIIELKARLNVQNSEVTK